MKKYLKYLLIPLILGLAFGYYQYNKPHKNLSKSEASYQLTASDLYNEFETDETTANTKYLDKVIEVSGKIQGYTQNGEVKSISLESESGLFGVICELDGSVANIEEVYEKGMTIRLKGICTGMLSDVVLVRCILAN